MVSDLYSQTSLYSQEAHPAADWDSNVQMLDEISSDSWANFFDSKSSQL